MKKILFLLVSIFLIMNFMVGCNNKNLSKPNDIKEFTFFGAITGRELNKTNVIQSIIAEKIGAKCTEKWLTNQTAEEAIGMMIASDEYPDFVSASTGHAQMLKANAYIPIDLYWDKYPNIKNFLTEAQWNKVRSKDGHIYIIPQFGITNGKDTRKIHNDQAFWIQTRVLKWAGYPVIKTLDQYFDLIERYLKAHPINQNGTENIGFEILCEDWKYYCLENPPFFLDGYPNDGCCIVDPETQTALDYNTTDTAKQYFNKLNTLYKKGIVDPECFTLNYQQYIQKLSQGRVLGMVDQYWNFRQADDAIKAQKLYDCTYVPLGITITEDVVEKYHTKSTLDVSNGLGITKSCKDIDGALKFINDLLSEEIQTLRFWGQKDVDYLVDEKGFFYRTEEMRRNAVDIDYRASHLCFYSYFPRLEGMSLDGINTWSPEDQQNEFLDGLIPEIKECLDAYGAKTYIEMLNPATENAPWFPMWSYSNTFTSETDYGRAKIQMDEIKQEYLPKVIMAEDFELAWEEYMNMYNEKVDIEAYLNELTAEVKRRIKIENDTDYTKPTPYF